MDANHLAILDTLPQFIGIVGADLRCLWANRSCADFLGLGQEGMAGKPIEELWGGELIEESRSWIVRALAGERVGFSRKTHFRGSHEEYFVRVELIPLPEGGFTALIHDLSATERSVRDRERLIHELDHRVNNILQVLQSIISLELQASPDGARPVLDALKSRIDALGLSYEHLWSPEPEGGWPVGEVLSKVAATVGPGDSATASCDEGLRISHSSLDAFIFIAAELSRWICAAGAPVVLTARRSPDGLVLGAEGEGVEDATRHSGAAGIALVDSFAESCGARPLRGGRRLTVVFPLPGARG